MLLFGPGTVNALFTNEGKVGAAVVVELAGVPAVTLTVIEELLAVVALAHPPGELVGPHEVRGVESVVRAAGLSGAKEEPAKTPIAVVVSVGTGSIERGSLVNVGMLGGIESVVEVFAVIVEFVPGVTP